MSSVFTPAQNAFRFYEDGKETGALALANDGTFRHVPIPGPTGAYVSTPDSVATSITGDLDLRLLITTNAFTTAGGQALGAKWLTTGAQRSYALYLDTTGHLSGAFSTDGSAVFGVTGSVPAYNPGARFWVRFTITFSGGTWTATVYTADWDGSSTTEPSSWTSIGSNTGSGSAIFDSTATLTLGAWDAGAAANMAGRVTRAVLYAGAVKKADFNPQLDGTDGATSVTSSATSEVWTLNGSAAIAAQSTNITRYVNNALAELMLRIRVQETGGKAGASTDVYQLQYNKNSAGWNSVTGASSVMRAFNAAGVADNAATTNQLGAGSGSFVAGKYDDGDGAVTTQLTASNYTEMLFSILPIWAGLVTGDVVQFRLLVNGATMTYNVTPQITVSQSITAPTSSVVFRGSLSSLGTRSGCRQVSRP